MARMALLLAGLPQSVPGVTLNRLCASGMDAVGTAFRAIASGEMELAIAGGVESMSRAPFVMGKAESGYSRNMKLEDTTIGWRFINPLMKAQYGVDAMPETADNVADDYQVSRADGTLSPCAASRRLRQPRRLGSSPKRSYRCVSFTRRARPWSSRTSTCARRPLWRLWPSSNRSMARTRRSLPATLRASTTVRPR